MEAWLLWGGTAAHRTGVQQGLIPAKHMARSSKAAFTSPRGRSSWSRAWMLFNSRRAAPDRAAPPPPAAPSPRQNNSQGKISPDPPASRGIPGPPPPPGRSSAPGTRAAPHRTTPAAGCPRRWGPLPPAAPGGGGEPPCLLGEQCQDLIRLLVGGLPQNKGLGLQVHETRLLCTAGFRHPAGCLGRVAPRDRPYRKPTAFPAPPGFRPGPGTPPAAQFYKIIPTILSRPQPALPFCCLSLGWPVFPAAMTGKC